jgi:DNA-binding GntR family transcriptional regulator
VAALYQSTHDARASCADHGQIVDALEAGDTEGAIDLMQKHIGQVEDALGKSVSTATDALERLRATLAPLPKPATSAH